MLDFKHVEPKDNGKMRTVLTPDAKPVALGSKCPEGAQALEGRILVTNTTRVRGGPRV